MPTTSAIIGYIASGLVLTTFWTNDLHRLRMLAILSNIAFISYGALVWLPPVLGLHLLLLPLNTIRLMRMSKTEPGSDHRQVMPSKVATCIAFDAVPPRAAVSGCLRRDRRMAIGARRLVRYGRGCPAWGLIRRRSTQFAEHPTRRPREDMRDIPLDRRRFAPRKGLFLTGFVPEKLRALFEPRASQMARMRR